MYHLTSIAAPEFLRDPELQDAYKRKRVLVLGGDGFLGSYVATALQRLGADVSSLSRRASSLLASTPITIHAGHLMQREVLEKALSNQEIVFDLAGSSGAVDSNRNSVANLAVECAPHLNAFQIAAEMPDPPLVVFCSSRTVYGKPRQLPVSETHPLAPASVYAIHKLTLEYYLQTFRTTHGLNYLIFRLSNPYGPQLELTNKGYGILNRFIWQTHQGEPIVLFGDGSQHRDYIYIDDVVEVFVRAAANRACHDQIFNLGGPASISMREAVGVLLEECPGSRAKYESWPADYLAVETGDYRSDLSKLRHFLSRAPEIGFRKGVRRALDSYRKLLPEVRGSAATVLTNDSKPVLEKAWEWENKRVVVTGASGFLGHALVARLLRMGAMVAAVHRRPLDPAIAAHAGLISMQLSLEDTERLNPQIKRFEPEVMFHMASRPDGPEIAGQAGASIVTNAISTINLLEMARAHGVIAFVFADSSKVYGNNPVPHRESTFVDPQSSYAVSKLAAWHYCRMFARLHNVPAVALRPTLIYGPAQGWNLFAFLANCVIAEKSLIELDGGLQTRDPLYVEDAIDAYLRAAESARQLQGRAIPIGGGQERTVKELAELFLQAAGRNIPIQICGQRLRPTEIMRSYCDNVDAWSALEWRPATPLTEGLRLTAEFLLSIHHVQV
jgi:UDP-glucose 4-epimerase